MSPTTGFSPVGLRLRTSPAAGYDEKARRLLEHGPVHPDDVVPTHRLLPAIKKLRVGPARAFEGKLLDAIGRIRRRIAENVEDLVLLRDLNEGGVLRRIKLRLRRGPLVGRPVLVLDVQLEVFARCRLKD